MRVTILHVVTLYLQLDDNDDTLVSSRSVCIFTMSSCNLGLCKEDILGVTSPLHQGASSLHTSEYWRLYYRSSIQYTQHCRSCWLLTRA